MFLALKLDGRSTAMFFAIAFNLAIAAASFPMIDLMRDVYGLADTNIENYRLIVAARNAVGFACVPLVVFLVIQRLKINVIAAPQPDPVMKDIALTARLLLVLLVGATTAAAVFLRLGGIDVSGSVSGAVQTAVYNLVLIYMLVLSGGPLTAEADRTTDLAVAVFWLMICFLFSKRELVVAVIPLLVRVGFKIPLRSVLLFGCGAFLLMFVNTLARGYTGDSGSILIRVLGNQFKYLERYSLSFDVYRHCYGIGTLMGFMGPSGYDAFYAFIFDPVKLSPTLQFRWDSSNLQERLNYAFCSVQFSYWLYSAFVFLFLYLGRKLNDIRYFRVALIAVLFSYGGYSFYNLPQFVILCLLIFGGVWRIVRAARDGVQSSSPSDWKTSL